MYDAVCIFNRGSNRGWADIQGKPLLLFQFKTSCMTSHKNCTSLFSLVIVADVLVTNLSQTDKGLLIMFSCDGMSDHATDHALTC